MIRTTRLWRSIAVVGVASLALAACGGDDDDDGTAAGDDESPAVEQTGDGELVLGTLLPQTGSLAFLGPPEFAGVDLAVEEINAAGGVLGQDVVVNHTDSGDTSTDIASQSVDSLLSQNVDAIIGAASSGVTATVIDAVVQSGTVMFSPANTSPDFTDYPDDGFYFRTAPSDVLQGRVMGDLVISDGHANVGIMALQDPYGEGLAENVTISVEEGGGTIAGGEAIIYDPNAANYATEVTQMAANDPDAIVLIGFAETLTIIPELVAQGIGPQDVPLYFVDGNLSNYGDQLPAGTLDGNKGTLPGAETTEDFQARALEIDPALEDFSYAPESYDAAILIALAAVAAEDDGAESIASRLVDISKEGTKCTTFEECVGLLEDGEDIDYDGASGPIEFSDVGDPTQATIGIYQYGPDNTYTNVEYREGQL
ncbi:MAG TPA: ABC transporter substrate-binding protein [Jiangellaceae bacterium]|nr:ABC transporter substrate-binding protein [Jiangellaceae bacterium]